MSAILTRHPQAQRVAEIKRTLDVLHKPGNLIEVRVLGIPGRGKPSNASGYFTDHEAAAEAVIQIERRNPAGIYVTLNDINPALLARSPNRITDFPDATTGDADVIRRRWLLIDVDPERPKGIPSSDHELESARIVSEEVRDWLHGELRFPEPFTALSGNGWHLLFPINLPNDQASAEIIRQILHRAASQFGGDCTPPGLARVNIDTTVANAGRVTKLYGTMTRKGYSIEGRPSRRSELVYVPDYLECPQEGVRCDA